MCTLNNVHMARTKAPRSRSPVAAAHAERVGTAEFRAHLAKYLERAKSGRTVIIQERGRNAYVLLRFEDGGRPPPFGCMRGRIEYTSGAVVGGSEQWAAGEMP